MGKVADESSKGNQDEWSYTVYDIDGGSKVTDQVYDNFYVLECSISHHIDGSSKVSD